VNRREFLVSAAAAAAFTSKIAGQGDSKAAKLARVSAMSGCFGRLLAEAWGDRSHVDPPALPGQAIDIMDLPEMLADRYGIHYVEVQQFHFVSTEPSYMKKFLGRLKVAKSRMSDMPLELDDRGYKGTISPCSPDPQARAKGIEMTKFWIDRAAMLECPSVMINQGTLPEDLTVSIEGLKTVSSYGASKNVAVLVEPRGRSTVDVLVELITKSGCYANPDIGNLGDEEKTERGLRMLYPLAKTVSHVKLNPSRFDFPTAIRISKEMGFKGIYSLEAGGPTPYETVQNLLDQLLQCM